MGGKYAGETDAVFLGEQKNALFARLRTLLKGATKSGAVATQLVLSDDDFELYEIHCRQYQIPVREGAAKFRLVPVAPEPGGQTVFMVGPSAEDVLRSKFGANEDRE